MIASRRKPSPKSLCQTIPSRLQQVESLCIEIRRMLRAAGLSRRGFAVELLARECLVNAVVHGNRRGTGKSVHLGFWIGRKWIRLEVKDEGRGFAWRKARQKSPDITNSSGRGLQLYALYADRVRFNRKGNQIALWIRKTI